MNVWFCHQSQDHDYCSGNFTNGPEHMENHKTSTLLIQPNMLVLAFVLLRTDLVARAQQDAASHPVELGIIVTSTEAEAAAVLRQLKACQDFGVLAKEKSINPTSNDGGYMGRMSPTRLAPELRSASAGIETGQLPHIIHISSGFAILKILPSVPPTEDLNNKRIASMISTGAIRLGPALPSMIFGMNLWSDEGSLTHTLHTVVIDRRGCLAANIEGNQFTARRLGDLVEMVMDRP
jgi:hypothetical protein